jgi:hypothetical protein
MKSVCISFSGLNVTNMMSRSRTDDEGLVMKTSTPKGSFYEYVDPT